MAANPGEFIDSTVEKYGGEGGRELCGAILESVQFASSYHDLIRPLQTIRLGFGSWPDSDEDGIPMLPIIGLSDGYYGFSMALNDHYPLDVLRLGIRPVVVHEVSHVAQFQHGKVNGELSKGMGGFTFLKYVFMEGTANWHAGRNQSRLYGSLPGVALHNTSTPFDSSTETASELSRLADIGCDFETSQLIDYLQGDTECPKRGYRLGLYIVRRALSLKLIEAAELVRLTSSEIQRVCEAIAV